MSGWVDGAGSVEHGHVITAVYSLFVKKIPLNTGDQSHRNQWMSRVCETKGELRGSKVVPPDRCGNLHSYE